jgi:hypothetical protein
LHEANASITNARSGFAATGTHTTQHICATALYAFPTTTSRGIHTAKNFPSAS